MYICYLCTQPITQENSTKEHIIPNAIGGKLKSKEIICANCNITCGAKLDVTIGSFFNSIASKLNIKRERGTVPTFTAKIQKTDQEVLVDPGWVLRPKSPSVEKRTDGKISITAGTKERVLQEAERLNKELEKDGKRLDFKTDPVRKVESSEEKTITLEVSVSVDDLLRGLLKVVTNLYVHETHNPENIIEASKFVISGGENYYIWFLNLHIAEKVFDNKPYHIVSIIGDKNQNALYGYCSLFGDTAGTICLLNSNYQGENINISYVFDPISGEKVECNIEFSIPKEQIEMLIKNKPNPEGMEYSVS